MTAPGSAQEHLAAGVDRKNGFAVRTTEPTRLGSLELGRTDRTGKDLGEDIELLDLTTFGEMFYRVVQRFLDLKELRKAQQLKHFVHLGLNFQQDQVTALGFDRFQERGKRPDAGAGYVVQPTTMKDQLYETGFDRTIHPFLKEVGVVRVDIAGKVQHDTILGCVDFLKPYLEAFVFFFVKSWDNIVVVHVLRFQE